MVTEVSSSHIPEQVDVNAPSWSQPWDAGEMKRYLKKGICFKMESVERIGIQPYWIRNIEQGAMEELRKDLGRWSKVQNGYLLGFTRPNRVPDIGFQGRHPHPYIYYKFQVVRYLYKPTVGQKLKGIITQFGQKAASCTVFNKFVATVYPQNEQEFNSWNIGDEVEFTVETFEALQRTVMLKGKSRKSKKGKKRKLEQDVTVSNEDNLEINETITEPTPAAEEETEPPKKKRKKMKKEREVS